MLFAFVVFLFKICNRHHVQQTIIIFVQNNSAEESNGIASLVENRCVYIYHFLKRDKKSNFSFVLQCSKYAIGHLNTKITTRLVNEFIMRSIATLLCAHYCYCFSGENFMLNMFTDAKNFLSILPGAVDPETVIHRKKCSENLNCVIPCSQRYNNIAKSVTLDDCQDLSA